MLACKLFVCSVNMMQNMTNYYATVREDTKSLSRQRKCCIYTEQVLLLNHNAVFLFAEAAGAISGSLVLFCKYALEILKIETAFFTNKRIQELRIRSCVCCGYAFLLWRDICGFCNQENGHWNHPCGFILDRHIYLAASHCHTQLKLDGWLRLEIKHYLFLNEFLHVGT